MKTKTKVARPIDILKMVEDELNLFNLKTKKRTRELSQARFIYFKLARKFCSYSSLDAIGRAVKRDHATVLHACRKIKELCDTDLAIRDDYNNLLKALTG